jgi:hypothetical protein
MSQCDELRPGRTLQRRNVHTMFCINNLVSQNLKTVTVKSLFVFLFLIGVYQSCSFSIIAYPLRRLPVLLFGTSQHANRQCGHKADVTVVNELGLHVGFVRLASLCSDWKKGRNTGSGEFGGGEVPYHGTAFAEGECGVGLRSGLHEANREARQVNK